MPAPNVTIEPILSWRDSRGYTLSDRIWSTFEGTNAQLDSLLSQAIAEGRSAQQLAKDLEQFLLPGRELKRTNVPYGSDASFYGMRLARSEITLANSTATKIAGIANPFVDRIYYNLSGAHKGDPGDPCEEFADTSDSQNGYAPADCPTPVESTHPNCATAGQLVKVKRGVIPIEDVKAGDYVLTHTGEYHRVKYAWNRQHSGVVYHVVTDTGVFELTGEHPVLTSVGWLNADALKVGDNIVYAAKGAEIDLTFSEPKGYPTKIGESFISDSITGSVMPMATVGFNSNLDFRDSEVDTIKQHTILSSVFDLTLVKGISKQAFKPAFARILMVTHLAAKATVAILGSIKAFAAFLAKSVPASAHNTTGLSHTQSNFHIVHGIVKFLEIGNLFTRLRGLKSRLENVNVESVSFFHLIAGGLAPFGAFTLPLDSNSVGTGSQGYLASGQQVTQYAVGDTQQAEQVASTVKRINIPFLKDGFNRLTELLFKSQGVILVNVNSVSLGMSETSGKQTLSTNGAVVFHDNLSSLSLEDVVGAVSRNTDVNEVIKLTQAHQHYSIVERVYQCQYDGLVYNMHVENDNTYTVNGAFVHNCMCYLTQGVISESDALALITDDPNAAEDARVFTDDNQFNLLELAIWGLAADYLEQLLGD